MNAIVGRISIVGAGVCIPDHLTWRALVVLGRAHTIHTVLDRSQIEKIPVDLGDKTITYMLDRYRTDRPRLDNYHEAIANIMKESQHHDICYLTLGHPLVYDSVAS